MQKILTNDYNEIGIFHQQDLFEPASEIVLINLNGTLEMTGERGTFPLPFLCVKDPISIHLKEDLYIEQKSVKDIDVKGKRVFCRVDFNVPMQDGKITDETRIHAALPTIQYLMEQGAKVILASHLGRPKGQVVEELRLTPVAKRLSEILGKDVKKADEAYGETVKALIDEMNEGDVLLP